MTCRFTALGVLLLAAFVPAFADDTEPKAKGKVYKTPQDVFTASSKAMAKKDYKTAVDCYDPASVKDVGAQLAAMALMMKKLGALLGKDELTKAFKPVFEAMDKHGLTEKAMKDINVDFQNPKSLDKAVPALAKLIKKPAQCAVDLIVAYEKAGGAIGAPQLKPERKLTDVKIDGNKATGTVVTNFNGNELKQQLKFVKGKLGWRIIPPPIGQALGAFGGGGLPGAKN